MIESSPVRTCALEVAKDPRYEQKVTQPRLDRRGAGKQPLGDGVANAPESERIQCLLLVEARDHLSHSPGLLVIGVEPADGRHPFVRHLHLVNRTPSRKLRTGFGCRS